MTAKELLRLNVPKLREEALKIPNVVGVTAMKKEDLIQLLAEAHGIVLNRQGSSAEKSEIKKRIRAFKARRDDALARKAYEELAQIRRGIRSLKRRSRELARLIKEQAAAAVPEPETGTTPQAGAPAPAESETPATVAPEPTTAAPRESEASPAQESEATATPEQPAAEPPPESASS